METDPRDYREIILGFNPDEFAAWSKHFGGDIDSPQKFFRWVESESHERRLCQFLGDFLHRRVLTSAERLALAGLDSRDASQRQAAAAEEANRIAKDANAIAIEANVKAERAIEIAQANMWWTAGAAIVAGIALVCGVWGLLK